MEKIQYFGARRPQVESRRFGRREVFKRAEIRPISGGTPVRCYVVNISNAGALLQMNGHVVSEDVFNLYVEEDDMLVKCAVAHRTNGNIGVKYVSSPVRASRIRGLEGGVHRR